MHSVFMISLSIFCLFCLLPSSRLCLCLYLSEENKDKDMEYGIGSYILDKNALNKMHSVFMISLFSLSILCLFCLLPSSRLCLYLSKEN